MIKDKYYKLAKSIEMPKWATHVAVSTVLENYAEPCRWCYSLGDYTDEPPSSEVWMGSSFNHDYWVFIGKEKLHD